MLHILVSSSFYRYFHGTSNNFSDLALKYGSTSTPERSISAWNTCLCGTCWSKGHLGVPWTTMPATVWGKQMKLSVCVSSGTRRCVSLDTRGSLYRLSSLVVMIFCYLPINDRIFSLGMVSYVLYINVLFISTVLTIFEALTISMKHL